jgi:SAM-dependent methyltransferase
MSASPAKFLKSYFDDFYIDYELQNPRKKMAFYKKLVEHAVPGATRPHPRPRLLEMGCAFGFFLSSLGPPWQRFGIDASEYALCRAHTRVPEAHLTVSDAAKLPFKGAFDIIVAFDVLEHIMELETIPENIASKLNPGGYFIFVVPVYDGPAGPIIRKLDRDTTHRHKRSRFFWLAWASSHFTVCQWQGVFRYLFPFGGYLHVPTKLLRRMAPAIAVVARKKNIAN